MKFRELYDKDPNRKVNPAVSASDLKDETVNVEIDEYVFTPEIVVNLFRILSNIKHNQGSHVGIWINGYYGSGKSHFLKYANYCLTKQYAGRAFARLIEHAQTMLGNSQDMTLEHEGVSLGELQALRQWYAETADIEMIMFNIGDVDNAMASRATTFTTIFWNQFNKLRGFNDFNLPFAQHLEKVLSDDGKFEDFKALIAQRGYDWQRNKQHFATGKLQLALQMAKEVDPSLSTDVIYDHIKNNVIDVSVDSFANELKQYLDKNPNPHRRILFFVDEVSQFIGTHRNLILQLQSLVKKLDEICHSQVWVACTAQQRLEEVVALTGHSIDPNDEVGKILGRFEVRASLQGTSAEYITQQRILGKKAVAEAKLIEAYKQNHSKIDAQFVLPSSYVAYRSEKDYADYYPFVPYQFSLVMRVLDSFLNLNYVDRQVKGNERSLINITNSIVRETADHELGHFISFDRFFGAMFQGSMQHAGQRAIANARQAVANGGLDDKERSFCERVVNVMFMICNLADNDKFVFPANIDNITTLLMDKIDDNKAALKNDVEKALRFLVEKLVVRKGKSTEGGEIYEFYTEDESQVAELIKNQRVDTNAYAEELRKIIFAHFNMGPSSNKINYCTRSFSVGCNIEGRSFLANNSDVLINFLFSSEHENVHTFSMNNSRDHLTFFLAPLIKGETEMQSDFTDYCRVQLYSANNKDAASDERRRTIELFQQRAKTAYDDIVKPKLMQILDACDVVSGQTVISAMELGAAKKQERYQKLLERHLQSLYTYAGYVVANEIPKNSKELSDKILAPTAPGLVNSPLSDAEKTVSEYLNYQAHDITVQDAVGHFAVKPYGWSEIATIYIVNELVRRQLYQYVYCGDHNVKVQTVAQNIIKEAGKFVIEKAQAIPQEDINAFIEAWKNIFQVVTVPGGNDAAELYRQCCENHDSQLRQRIDGYNKLLIDLGRYPFAQPIKDAVEQLTKWSNIRDKRQFFSTIASEQSSAATLMDKCHEVGTFKNQQLSNYEKCLQFVSGQTENFAFLSQEDQEAVNMLVLIKDDKEPWSKMQLYFKLQKELSAKIEEERQRLREIIKCDSHNAYDEQTAYAKSKGVPCDAIAQLDATLILKTSSQSCHALTNYADTSAFYAEQLERINAAIPKPSAPQGGTNEPQPSAPIIRRKVIPINTHTTQPLRTEADVDLYLQSIKAEILKHLDEHTELIIK